MPRRDQYHDHLVDALKKDGWKITFDPLVVEIDGIKLYVDVAAEKSNADKIAVEIKNFVGISNMNEFQKALG